MFSELVFRPGDSGCCGGKLRTILDFPAQEHTRSQRITRTPVVSSRQGGLTMETSIFLADGTQATNPLIVDNLVVVPDLLLLRFFGWQEPRACAGCTRRSRDRVHSPDAGGRRRAGRNRWGRNGVVGHDVYYRRRSN